MFHFDFGQGLSKEELYAELENFARGMLADERDLIANAANLSSLIYNSLDEVNWVGFYLLKDDELVVGPFQGKPACVRIAMGKGVCGTAAERRETMVVEDVDAFEGHIPCDADSRSEIVVPLVKDGELLGVLDIDSPVTSRFDDVDRRHLERIAETFIASIS